jgi:hypothetical protein
VRPATLTVARTRRETVRSRLVATRRKPSAGSASSSTLVRADGQRVAGIYRRSVLLASGRYAMLDDGMGFSLVPWRPVIEQRLDQQLAATVRGGGVSWEIGRQRGPSVG